MKHKLLSVIVLSALFISYETFNGECVISEARAFNFEKDLILLHSDCKTDVDDLHTIAAFATLISYPGFSKIRHHAVGGTYGIQQGLYVPPNDLLQLAFGDNWTDAHENIETAVRQVKVLVKSTLADGGDIWIAEGGQSDFTAQLVKSLKTDLPETDLTKRIHVVQHSNWNEQVTSPDCLQYVKENTDYHKIADGNVAGNGTPGFRSPQYTHWQDKIKDPRLVSIWRLATDLANRFNGKEGRYNNEAVAAGGLDFSDLSEVCWILGLQEIKDTEHFFDMFAR